MLDVAKRKEANVAAVEEAPANRASECQDMVLLSLGEQQYAIPLAAVAEVLPLPLLSRPPRMPAILDGFMNLGGKAIAVVNLARLFAVPDAPPTLYAPLLLLRGNPASIALKIERVLGVVSVVENAKVRLNERSAGNECAQGVAIVNDRVVVLLSPERILLRQERDCLADLQATELKRLDALQENTP